MTSVLQFVVVVVLQLPSSEGRMKSSFPLTVLFPWLMQYCFRKNTIRVDAKNPAAASVFVCVRAWRKTSSLLKAGGICHWLNIKTAQSALLE
jgi:hypothetical protein